MFIVLLCCVMGMAQSQQETTLTQPTGLETATFSLYRNTNGSGIFTTSVNFMRNYTETPVVFTALVSLNGLVKSSVGGLEQLILEIGGTGFTHQMTVSVMIGAAGALWPNIKVIYLAFAYTSYPYIQFNNQIVTLPASTSTNRYFKIGYIPNINPLQTALNQDHTYSLNVILSGYSNLALTTAIPSFYIDAVQYTSNQYLLNVKTENLQVGSIQILRMLIDTTQMEAAVTGLSSLVCRIGTIVHLSDPNAVEDNPDPDFLPFAMLYGVKGWVGWSFSLTSFTYIFNNTTPRVQATIGYVLFQTETCPTNQLYVATQNLCYSYSAAFYYQATPLTMVPCPYSCYTCVGPLSTQCRSCVTGWNRYLHMGRCQCIVGFYDPGGPVCKNCTLAISGCYTCSSSTNCLTCLPGCNAINFDPIYCDCPALIQANYSYSCPNSYYYDYDVGACLCLPQTYLNPVSNLCFPCSLGCYICAGSPSYCLVCLDAFTLVDNSCIFYANTYALLGQRVSLASPYIRCLRWDSTGTVCIQKCKKYYYQQNCYGSCPLGTFNISQPWLTCQPCRISCQMCYNLTLCLQCQPTYFYFNVSTLACGRCSANCITCLNSSYCTSCENYYNLLNNECQLTMPVSAVCSQSCGYCLVGSGCLQCNWGYYLNLTDSTCYSCLNNHAFKLGAVGECIQICGDGVVVFAACDDGNSVNGDGCSINCTIQKGFQCSLVGRQSYCWKETINISWKIYPLFGSNQVVILVQSGVDLNHSILNLGCHFNSKLISTKLAKNTIQYLLSYNQSIIIRDYLGSGQNISTIQGANAINKCWLEVNKLVNYTIIVGGYPQLLYIDYGDVMEKIGQSSTLQKACEIGTLIVLSIALLGLVPVSSFASLRVSLLMLVTYLDYYQMPINSFKPFQSILKLLFMDSGNDTRSLISFNNSYYFSLLWHAVGLYLGVFLFQQFFMRSFNKFCSNMDWKVLISISQHIIDNKARCYQSLYTSYEIVCQNWVFADVGLILFMVLHLLVSIIAKFHFFYTFQALVQASPSLAHSLMTDQLQNVSVALLTQFSSQSVSYTPILLTLYAAYNICCLVSSQSTKPVPSRFKITQLMAIWHYGINLLVLIVLQCLKCGCMWRGLSGISLTLYQSLGGGLGLAMSLISSISILLSSGATLVSAAIRIYQLHVQHEEVEQAATVDQVSVVFAAEQ